jgi:hypothetical protein
MSNTMPKLTFAKGRYADAGALLLVLVLMALSWYLVSGVATAVYDQYETYGDPPKSIGPASGIAGSQLGHQAFFWSERAFHYRTILMFAVDDYDDPGTLSLDTQQQHPDGVNAWAEYTLMMEPVYGQLYRWFGQPDELLVDFLLRLIPLVHVLLFLPIFWLARSLGVRPWLAVCAVLVYATCTMGFTRLAGSLLLKENFSLLWLMVFLAAHHRACNKKDFFALLVAAAALILALASWHLSQFLLLVIFLASGISATPTHDASRGFWPGSWWPAAVYLAAGVLAGFTPSLLSRGFFLSLPMAALVAWLIRAWWSEHRSGHAPNPRIVWLLSLIALGALSFFNPLVDGDYNHVSGLLFQKIAHGFVLPTDPSSLPFDVRVFWAPPFTSPHLADILPRLGYHLLLLLPAGVWFGVSAVRRRLNPGLTGFLLTVLAYLAAWLLIERLGVVFWPVAVVMVALAGEQALGKDCLPLRMKPPVLVLLLILVASTLNLTGILKPQIKMARLAHAGSPINMGISDAASDRFKVELFDWFRRETTGPGSPVPGPVAGGVLGEAAVSPQVLLYARRPIVLNSQFENTPIRERYHQYLELLFGTDEKAFAQFLEDTKTAYLFINRSWAITDGPGSISWQAGVGKELSVNMMMLRLHFRPESFSFLQPVFDNEYYRVFRVGGARPNDPDAPAWLGRHNAWWAENNFRVENGHLVDPKSDRTRIMDAENQWRDLQDRLQKIVEPLNRQASASSPPLMALQQQRLQLIYKKFIEGSEGDAARFNALEQRIAQQLKRPHPKERKSVGALLGEILQGENDQMGMLQLLNSEPSSPENYASAGQLHGMLQEYGAAALLLEKAASFFPLRPLRRGHDGRAVPMASPMASQMRQECVWWNLGAERFDQAVMLAERFLPFETPGSRQASFYRALIESARKSNYNIEE